ncbi:uncharacterized protein LOC133887257 [Phragmites australis]|uniref:uncharacterized protein LOC133887257 n=1 Tax=Phragmites australis TaxID=29695 RepID=UPI002D7936F4|nr:uncharacterized protein LOC133887257 [Phragmites australis]
MPREHHLLLPTGKATIVWSFEGRAYIVEVSGRDPLARRQFIYNTRRGGGGAQRRRWLRSVFLSFSATAGVVEEQVTRLLGTAGAVGREEHDGGLQEVRAGDARLQAECAVCLQDFRAEDALRAMPCSHAFHQDCTFRWLRISRVCPLCCHALPTQQQEDDEEEGKLPAVEQTGTRAAIIMYRDGSRKI